MPRCYPFHSIWIIGIRIGFHFDGERVAAADRRQLLTHQRAADGRLRCSGKSKGKLFKRKRARKQSIQLQRANAIFIRWRTRAHTQLRICKQNAKLRNGENRKRHSSVRFLIAAKCYRHRHGRRRRRRAWTVNVVEWVCRGRTSPVLTFTFAAVVNVHAMAHIRCHRPRFDRTHTLDANDDNEMA